MMFPGRLLIVSYAAAAAGAIALLASGMGVLAAGATLWLGGALVTLCLAATPWFRHPEGARREIDPEEAARAMRAWEEERLGAASARQPASQFAAGATTR